NSALLPNGTFLVYDGQSFGFDARVWDPIANTLASAPAPANIFCSGFDHMVDGRVFVAGGHNNAAHNGLPVGAIFDPTAQTWTQVPDMAFPRWYPTVTTLPDGRVIVLSGETNCDGCYVRVPEIYDPTTNAWTQLNSAQFSFSYYPHVF